MPARTDTKVAVWFGQLQLIKEYVAHQCVIMLTGMNYEHFHGGVVLECPG